MLVLLQSLLPLPSRLTKYGGVAGGSRTVRLRCSGDRRRSFYRLCASSSSRAESIVMEGDREKFGGGDPPIKLLIVEMGVGYDQHGQDITVAAMRACRDAISANSIPAFRRSIPGVSSEQMKLLIKLGVPRATQQFLDIERVKSVFPYGQIIDVEIMDGGMICSSGVYLEAMGDKNDDCYVVNAAVYVGY
ncbi:50S ribosomal protein L34 isoform X2 [Wolffia australiana]